MTFTMVRMVNNGSQQETTFVTINKDNGNLMLPNLTLDFLPCQVIVSATFKDLVLCYSSIITSLKEKLRQYYISKDPGNFSRSQLEQDLLHIRRLLEQQTEEPKRQYYICNPLTRQWLSLPPLTLLPVFDDESHCFDALVCEDANDQANLYRFRVVVMAFPSLDLMVFCSEIGRWKNIHLKLDPTGDEIPLTHGLQGVVCNKTVYFGYKSTYGEFDPFNVTSEACDGATLAAKPLPMQFGKTMCVNLVECQGRLLAIRSISVVLLIWELSYDDNASSSTWEHFNTVRLKHDNVGFSFHEYARPKVAALQRKGDGKVDELYLFVEDRKNQVLVANACYRPTFTTLTSRLPQRGFSFVARHRLYPQPSPTPPPLLSPL